MNLLTRPEQQPFRVCRHLEVLGIDTEPIRRAERVLAEVSEPKRSTGPDPGAQRAELEAGGDLAALARVATAAPSAQLDRAAVSALIDAAVEAADRRAAGG